MKKLQYLPLEAVVWFKKVIVYNEFRRVCGMRIPVKALVLHGVWTSIKVFAVMVMPMV